MASTQSQQRLVAVLLVVRREERLAVARAAAVVDAQHHVAVVHEILDEARCSPRVVWPPGPPCTQTTAGALCASVRPGAA